MKYRYKLEKGSKKYFCPACNKKTFVRYIDNSTNDLAPDQFGRCDRESKCNYHSYPKSLKNDYLPPVSIPKQIRKPQRVFIPNEVLKTTIQGYEYNAFVKNLCKMFPVDGISKVLSEYCLGTVSSGYMKGGCTFPFIDKDSKIRAIQCKTFDNENHIITTLGKLSPHLSPHFTTFRPNQGYFNDLKRLNVLQLGVLLKVDFIGLLQII